ncbi:hypothetical protein pb186bvf_015451 [Paramecium bursaria]
MKLLGQALTDNCNNNYKINKKNGLSTNYQDLETNKTSSYLVCCCNKQNCPNRQQFIALIQGSNGQKNIRAMKESHIEFLYQGSNFQSEDLQEVLIQYYQIIHNITISLLQTISPLYLLKVYVLFKTKVTYNINFVIKQNSIYKLMEKSNFYIIQAFDLQQKNDIFVHYHIINNVSQINIIKKVMKQLLATRFISSSTPHKNQNLNQIQLRYYEKFNQRTLFSNQIVQSKKQYQIQNQRRMNNILETFLRTLIEKIDYLTLLVTEIQSKQKKSNESIKSQKIDLQQLRKIFNDYLSTDIQVIHQEIPSLKQTLIETRKMEEPETHLKNWINQNYELIKDEKQLVEFDQILSNIQVAVAPTGTKFHTIQCNHISKSYKMIGLKQALKQKSHCIDCCTNSKVVIQNI